MDYFDYQTTAGVVRTKTEVENKGMMGGNPVADETLIKHNADPANGTYYVMINATGLIQWLSINPLNCEKVLRAY
jgi:hypothetical protein